MPQDNLILPLAKVLIAVGWVDGQLAHEEINSMKDLLFHLPDLTARQWASLQIYMDSPVEEAERNRLIAELEERVKNPQNKQLVLTALQDLMTADGQLSQEEEAVLSEIKFAMDSDDGGFGSKLSMFVKSLTGKRELVLVDAPNREDYFDVYVRIKVYYDVRRRVGQGEVQLDLPDDTLRKLSLAGGMMAQIARVNPQVTDGEFAMMVGALQDNWSISRDQAAFVAEVAVSDTSANLDRFRLEREFAQACTYDESLRFLDVLFAVATADGDASYEEIEEIRLAAGSLKLSHRDFINAKLKVPRAQREQ